MNFIIRQETKEDYNEVYNLIRAAFEVAEFKDGDEQDYAENLRRSKNFIPELSMVAECDRELIGQVMFTETFVKRDDGNGHTALLLSPLSVLPGYMNRGVGTLLVQEGLMKARKLGYEVVFVCGAPSYYNRFGFKSISGYGIKSSANISPEYVLVYEIVPGILQDIKGTVEVC